MLTPILVVKSNFQAPLKSVSFHSNFPGLSWLGVVPLYNSSLYSPPSGLHSAANLRKSLFLQVPFLPSAR